MSRSRDNSNLRPDASHSRPGSRPRTSRNSSRSSIPYLPQGPEDLALPEGAVREETAELLHEFVHPHHHEAEETLVGTPDIEQHRLFEQRKEIPWWRRPSPWWFLVFVPFSAVAISATLAPKIEIYTRLACEVYRPEFSDSTQIGLLGDDERQRKCASDPTVQAAVATLNMVIATTMGTLGCLTTGFWGSFSDRYGRIITLTICALGLLYADITMIAVAKFSKHLPGGYWFLVTGGFVEGCLGSVAAASAGVHAYIADCTDPSARSRTFSLFLGLLFTGMAFGPTIGGLLVKYTGNPLVIFYITTGIHLTYNVTMWFVVPESLPREKMLEARRVYNEEKAQDRASSRGFFSYSRFKGLFSFLNPLKLLLFAPEDPSTNPLKAKKDQSLTFVSLSYGFAIMLMGSYNYKFQYTSAAFGWTSEQIGYWLSVVGITRAFYLTLVLPLMIKLLQPKSQPIQLPSEPDEPLQPTSPSSSPSPSSPSSKPSSSSQQHHTLSFDLKLAKFSLFTEMLAYSAMPFAKHPIPFTILSMITCLGTSFSPAAQSVALGLYTQRGGKEVGKLFGAMSVMQALGSQIIGPALFGMTYVKTVATFPTAIFFVSSAVVTTSFVFLSLVRLPPTPEPSSLDVEESPLLDEDTPALERRDVTLVDPSPGSGEVPLIVVEGGSEEEDRGRKNFIDNV
ncbi:hypothetical protein ABKN59_003276 [Abortiporus biennis]